MANARSSTYFGSTLTVGDDTIDVQVPTNESYTLKLGDNAGVTKWSLLDSDSVEVASIDSNGAPAFLGFSGGNPITFTVGAAIDGTKYQIGRDADATNQLHFNFPTNSGLEISDNDVAVMRLITPTAAGITAPDVTAQFVLGNLYDDTFGVTRGNSVQLLKNNYTNNTSTSYALVSEAIQSPSASNAGRTTAGMRGVGYANGGANAIGNIYGALHEAISSTTNGTISLMSGTGGIITLDDGHHGNITSIKCFNSSINLSAEAVGDTGTITRCMNYYATTSKVAADLLAVTESACFYAEPFFSSNVILHSGLKIRNPTGTATTNYGIYIENQTAGTTDYGIYVVGSDTAALYTASGKTQFTFGASDDFVINANTTTHTSTAGVLRLSLSAGVDNTVGISSVTLGAGDFAGGQAFYGQVASGGILSANDQMSAYVAAVTGHATDSADSTLFAYQANITSKNTSSGSYAAYFVGGAATGSPDFDFALESASGDVGFLDYSPSIFTLTLSAGNGDDINFVTSAAVTAGNGGNLTFFLGAGAGGGTQGVLKMSSADQDIRWKNNGTGVFRIEDSGSTSALTFDHNGSNSLYNSTIGGHNFSQSAAASGVPTLATFTGAANTGLTVSTEDTDVYFNLSATKTWATATAVTIQRDVRIAPRTYAAAGASSAVIASTFNVGGAPIIGSNFDISFSSAAMIGDVLNGTLNAATGSVYGLMANVAGVSNGIGTVGDRAALMVMNASTVSLGNQTANASIVAGIFIDSWGVDSTTLTRTVSKLASLYVAGAPSTTARTTITNGPYAIYSDAGTNRFDGTVQLGNASGGTGLLNFKGNTSGTVGLTVAAAAGTYALTLPTALGSAGQALYDTDGAGTLGWLSVATTSSGVYTPTRSAEANMDANVTMSEAQYMRVGNTVTVSGQFTADPTLAATTTSFEMTLPVASNIGAVEDVSGTAVCGNIVSMCGAVTGVAANDTAKVFWKSSDVTSQTWSYSFSYQVI